MFPRRAAFAVSLARPRASVLCPVQASPYRPRGVVPLPLEQAHTIGSKPPPPFFRDKLHPRGRGPDKNPRTSRPRHSSGRISDIGLQLSFGCLVDSVAHLFYQPTISETPCVVACKHFP